MSEAEISPSIARDELVVFAVTGSILTARIRSARFGADAGPLTAKHLHAELDRLDPPPPFIVLDFTDTDFISSAGLGACLTMFQDIRERDCIMVVYGLSEDLRSLFEITGMDGLLNVVRTAEELAEVTG